MKVDVIVATGVAVQPTQKATAAIPIVMIRTSDPVGAGYVASLARPGRNITGLSNINLDVSVKYLERLRVAVPQLSRVAVLVNPVTPNYLEFLKRLQAAGKTNSLKISPAQAGTASQIEAVFRRDEAGA